MCEHRCRDTRAPLFAPCYASVLMHGADPKSLEQAVREEEARQIQPCITAWCQGCDRLYLLRTGEDLFPCRSAFVTHQLSLARRLRACQAPCAEP